MSQCVCDAYGGCPQGCPQCRVCDGETPDADWIREHGDDLIPVKLIDLLTVVGRLAELERQEAQPPDVLIMRLVNSDLPRLRGYLPVRALEEL